jgi:hypothetical protein
MFIFEKCSNYGKNQNFEKMLNLKNCSKFVVLNIKIKILKQKIKTSRFFKRLKNISAFTNENI